MNPTPTVFIVDDDAGVRTLLCTLAETARLAVAAYDSAEAFLDAYEPGRPGCLVLDVQLPGMSGPDLLERLAAQGTHLPVIVISGQMDVPTTVRAMRLGAADILEKPFDIHVLLSRIQQLMRQGPNARPRQSLSGNARHGMRNAL